MEIDRNRGIRVISHWIAAPAMRRHPTYRRRRPLAPRSKHQVQGIMLDVSATQSASIRLNEFCIYRYPAAPLSVVNYGFQAILRANDAARPAAASGIAFAAAGSYAVVPARSMAHLRALRNLAPRKRHVQPFHDLQPIERKAQCLAHNGSDTTASSC